MMKRFAILIESSNVQGKDDLPGARLDVQDWVGFLKSDLGGAWSDGEIWVANKPCSRTVGALLDEHSSDYVFLAFSGHGREDAFTHIAEVCLNDLEGYVPVDVLSPKTFGTSVFDCCRCLDRAGRAVQAICEDSMEGLSNKIAFANERCSFSFLSARNAAVINGQKHRRRFLAELVQKRACPFADLTSVRMFACASGESAMDEDENAGGYYTTFLIESAKAWGQRSHGVYSTKAAHDGACTRMANKNPQQHPQYVPVWQSYPFAVRV